jgi:hypothetical protein
VRLDWALLCSSALGVPPAPPSALGLGVDTFFSVPVASIPEGLPKPTDAEAAGSPVTFTVVGRLLVTRAEAGRQRTVELQVQDADGERVLQLQIHVVAMPAPDLPPGWDVPLNALAPIMISPRKFGHYSIEVFLDNAHAKTIPFRIVAAQFPGLPQA